MGEALQDDIFLDTNQAAELLNLSPSYLVKGRIYGGGPVYIKLGRNVRYRRADLLEWAAQFERHTTSESDAA